MTSKEILQKAINKAVKSGYINTYRFDASVYMPYKRYLTLIFDHRFAKAFWGEDHTIVKVQNSQIYCQTCSQQVYEGMPMQGEWQHHLQQMVLEENPLKYLEKFL